MPVNEAKLLEGKVLAADIQGLLFSLLEGIRSKGNEMPRLVALRAGENSANDWYLDQQEKLAKKFGMIFEKINVDSQESLEKQICNLNRDATCHGIFITLPLPKGWNPDKAALLLDPRKDVEGIHPTSLGLIVLRRGQIFPPTAYAAYRLIQSTRIELRGKKACIIGQSAIVGRPLQMILGEKRVTTMVCNTGTSIEDLEVFVRLSDIVVACAGKPGFVKGEWIKPGAIVIDVGTTEVNGKLVGDVEFEEAKKRAGFITPVPGGVGPLTVTMLMQNLITAYKWQKGI